MIYMEKVFPFRLFLTSDLHGHLMPTDYAHGRSSSDSLANVASIIKANRTENSVLIDLGDTIQGSPMMEYHQQNRHRCPNPAALCFNYLKYDYFIPGNHDFNYGRNYLESFINQLSAATLCANILTDTGEYAFGLPYEIISYPEGPKVAIIGVTTQYIPHWEKKHNIHNLVFKNAFEVARDLVAQIRQDNQADLVILAYHGGFERDLETFEPYVEDTGENLGSKMLASIKGIDILLTGHQHRTILQSVGDTLVIQPKFFGKALAMIDVVLVKKTKWIIESKQGVLIDTADYVADKDTCALLKEIEAKTERYLDKVVGYVPNDDMRIEDGFEARFHKHKIVSLINRVQMEKTGAMISCCSLGNDVTGFGREITIRNILSTYVFPNDLVMLEIDGANLKLALEKNAEYFAIENGKIVANPKYSFPKMEHYNYDMFDGIDYTIDVSRPIGSRIISLRRAGKDIAPEDSFTLAMNNYRATGGGEFTMYRNLKIIREFPTDIASLLIEYIKKRKTIVCEETDNIKVIMDKRK